MDPREVHHQSREDLRLMLRDTLTLFIHSPAAWRLLSQDQGEVLLAQKKAIELDNAVTNAWLDQLVALLPSGG